MRKNLLLCALGAACAVFASCARSEAVASVNEDELFTLSYGSFEDELNLFDLALTGNVPTYMTMRDGFFYIANGESRKIIETNSYGDLLSLYYNGDAVKNLSFGGENPQKSTKKSVAYPFNTLGPLSVDSRKCLYVVDTLPEDSIEHDDENRLLLSNVVLRFGADGSFIDYIGQQGPGGTPFPFVRNIYTTRANELVVVCTTNDGPIVYWFNRNGFLLYKVPLTNETVPRRAAEDEPDSRAFLTIENVVPDCTEHRLYLKIDSYEESVDPDLKVQYGINYRETLLYPIDLNTGEYGEPMEIPPYEYSVAEGAEKETYVLPFDFLGVTENGWFFFIVPDEGGYLVQMVQGDGQRIVRRTLPVDHGKVLYYSLSLGASGIISALFIRPEHAQVLWWRTDSLLASFISK